MTSGVMVTGANGFVGRALCRQLHEQNQEVVAAVRGPDASGELPVSRSVETGDLAVAELPVSAFAGIDCVIHLASRAHVRDRDVQAASDAFRRVNVAGTLNLARQAARAGARRFVFVSSIKACGERTRGNVLAENDACRPDSPYGHSKREAEERLFHLAHETGLEVVVVRPPLVIGAGAKGNLLHLMRWIRRGVPLPLEGIDNRRSLVGLNDLCAFLMLVARHPRAPNQVFHVCHPRAISTSELGHMIGEAMACQPRFFSMPPGWMAIAGRLLHRQAEMESLLFSLQTSAIKAREILGWSSREEISVAIKDMVQAFQADGAGST